MTHEQTQETSNETEVNFDPNEVNTKTDGDAIDVIVSDLLKQTADNNYGCVVIRGDKDGRLLLKHNCPEFDALLISVAAVRQLKSKILPMIDC